MPEACLGRRDEGMMMWMEAGVILPREYVGKGAGRSEEGLWNLVRTIHVCYSKGY